MRAVVALDHGDDAGGGVAQDHRRLLLRPERARELVAGRRVGHRPAAQAGDGLQVGRAEPSEVAHGDRLRALNRNQPTSSGKRSRASWVDWATMWPRLSHRTQVSSTMPSATRPAVMRMPSQPGAGRART